LGGEIEGWALLLDNPRKYDKLERIRRSR